MSIAAIVTSPLNCRHITWLDGWPMCTRTPGTPHEVSEEECAVCEFWSEATQHQRMAARSWPLLLDSRVRRAPL